MPSNPMFLRSDMNEVEQANAELVLDQFRKWGKDFDPAAAFAADFAPQARSRAESGVQSPVKADLSKWKIGADEVVGDAKMYIDIQPRLKSTRFTPLARWSS